jgi:hypothetical protein
MTPPYENELALLGLCDDVAPVGAGEDEDVPRQLVVLQPLDAKHAVVRDGERGLSFELADALRRLDARQGAHGAVLLR